MVAGMGTREGLCIGYAICLISLEESNAEDTEIEKCILDDGAKSCLQGMEISHAGIPGKALWVNTKTNGDGYRSSGRLSKIFNNLYLHPSFIWSINEL